jgi:hypothetical protein
MLGKEVWEMAGDSSFDAAGIWGCGGKGVATGFRNLPHEAARHGLDSIPHARTRAVEGAIGYDTMWHFFVNVTPEELRGSAGPGRQKVRKQD